MSLHMTMDESAGQTGFGGKKGTSIKVTHSPGGNCSFNIFQPDADEVPSHTVSSCQADRNKSHVFDNAENAPSAKVAEKPAEKQQQQNNTSEPSTFYNDNYRPSTKVRNPPGGVSSISFG